MYPLGFWSMKPVGLYILLIYFTNHYRICAIILWYLLENEWAEKQMKKFHILNPYVELIFFSLFSFV